MASTLQSYLTTTRFVLHDTNSITFTDAQLINCINLARDQVITDSLCAEAIPLIPLVTGQESYTFASILPAVQNLGVAARTIQSILFVNFVQTKTPPYIKIPLRPLPFQVLNERYRINPVQSLCEAYSVIGIAQSLYVGPAPSGSNFQLEIRLTWLPNPMATYPDQETAIPSPLSEALVPLMAAAWAWENNDDMESAQKIKERYKEHLADFAAAMPPYVYEPYSSIY